MTWQGVSADARFVIAASEYNFVCGLALPYAGRLRSEKTPKTNKKVNDEGMVESAAAHRGPMGPNGVTIQRQ